MISPHSQTTAAARPSAVIAILLPCLLTGNFLWKLLTPAYAFPLRTEQVMTMTFDLLMIVGLFGLKKSMPVPLFWIALAAGVGLFALRLSHDGWWTGHLTYWIPPR
jgi:hypothetical protein